MATTVYVLSFERAEQGWIRAALEGCVGSVVMLVDARALRAASCPGSDCCLVVSAEPDGAATLNLVRELRQDGITIPVVVLGSHSAFRTAVDIARMEATSFLERPVSSRQLLQAVLGALRTSTC